MPTLRQTLAAGLLIAAACLPVRAQQQPSQSPPAQPQDESSAPIPAYHSPLASQADNSDQTGGGTPEVAPDDHALAGAQHLTLGSSESRSYWQPHVDVSATADSNAFGASNSGWTTYESVLGGINLHKISGPSDLTLGYAGGAVISSDGGTGNYVLQQLNVAERITAKRFVFSFLENLYDLPQALLGYGSLTGEGTSLEPGLAPVNSILTTRGQQLTSSSVGEMDVKLTRRSSITLVGGYYLLHYFENQPTLLNTDTITAQAGYNWQVSPKNTLAVLYRYSDFQYSDLNQTIRDNVVQLSYGRRVTGRLAFQIAAGPDFTSFGTPVLQNSTGTTTSSSQVSWSASGFVNYQLRRGSLGASYFHGVSTGSGVQAGSENDNLTATFSRRLTRTVTGNINGGYSRNKALAFPGFGIFNQSYNYAFAGASISRPWGRSLSLFASYQAQYQYSNDSFCVGSTCGFNVLAHLISVGLHWQSRPLLF